MSHFFKNKLCFGLLLIFSVFYSSCGYRFGSNDLLLSYSTISIPYVEGDIKGLLTSVLIEKMATRGALRYTTCGGDTLLQVCLLQPQVDNIGFILVPTEDGTNHRTLGAEEARLSIKARVSLVDAMNLQCILGPIEIGASITFDYEPDLSNINFHQFALGQLEMENLAEDAAYQPLYNQLAEKIVDYVNYSW